jgi:hypothetical protein
VRDGDASGIMPMPRAPDMGGLASPFGIAGSERRMWLWRGVPIAGMLLLVACGGMSQPVDAVATQAAPLAATAQAAAGQIAPAGATAAAVGGTAIATGGQLAATAQAAATQAIPAAATAVAAAQGAVGTAQVAATQMAPAAATARAALTQAPINIPALGTPIPVPGVGAGGPVEIVGIQVGFPDTVITIRNTSPAAIDLGDWSVRVSDATARLPTSVRVPPGGTVALHTTTGTSAGSDVYLGETAAILIANLRPGARIALVDGQGKVAAEIALP